MEANELYNFSISPLVTSSFCLEWSEDNHISLITHRGVHIFEFVPHPMCIYPTLRFWRTFVYPSEFFPAEALGGFVDEALWKMKRDEIYELLMLEATTPKINDKTPMNPRIIKIAWSPAKLADPSKCLAAIVTSAGSIEILYKLGKDWLSVWNLTERWSCLVQEESKIILAEATETSFGEISWPEHAKRLLGTAIAWSPLFHDFGKIPLAYLVASFRSSEIVVARVERIADLERAAKPEIIYQKRMEITSRIGQLSWIVLEDNRNVILVGYADGRIHGLGITLTSDKVQDEILFRYEDRVDRIPPSLFRFTRQPDGNIVILATKSSCLIALSLDNSGQCRKKRYLRLEGFSITGLTMIDSEIIILTTQDARMYAIKIQGQEELSRVGVEHDLKTSKVQYLGAASSPNGAILLNVTSPDGMYDHLINREPSTVQVFALKGERWDPWGIVNEKIRVNASLHEYWDCLESLRIQAAKSPEPRKILPAIPADMDDLKIDKLRIIMWLTLITQVIEKRQILRGIDRIVGEISEAQPLIFLISACKLLDRLSMKTFLSDEEKRCASFLRLYMEIYLAGEMDDNESGASRITQRVLTSFRSSSHIDAILTDSCGLCGEILSELPWIADTCPTGHKLSRCSVSLLQITTVNYRSCPACERLFHPSLDLDCATIRCLYCDLPAIQDSRVSSSVDGAKWKNLSKRPAAYGQPENMRTGNEMESPNVSGTNEKSRRRGVNNPHTFAVIVNRDQDDDSLITETWQEF